MRTVLVLLAVVLGAAGAQAQGSISGCIRDDRGGRLPGSKVTIWGPQFKQVVMAPASGCYTVTGVPPGSYTVAAELGACGFYRRKVTDVQVGASEVSHVDLALPVAGCDASHPPMRSVLELWDLATYIVHGRIMNATTDPKQDSIRYDVAPLTVLRWYPAEPADEREVGFVQSRRGRRFRTGDEVIVFMVESPYEGQPRPAWVHCLVTNGKIRALYDDSRMFDGMKVTDFIATLRTLSSRSASAVGGR